MTLPAISTLTEATSAIRKIKEQGEGTAGSPYSEGSLAHYFRFGEMFHEHRYEFKDGIWDYSGDELPMPRVKDNKVFSMAPIPNGGYPGISDHFDKLYSQVLRDMEAAWSSSNDQEGQKLLDRAIRTMANELPDLAVALMQKKISRRGRNTYGPSFRYLAC